jgi:hypothetical protein
MDSRDEIALRCFSAMLVSMEAALQYISRRELLAFTSNVEAGNISPQTSDSLPNIPFVYSIRRMGSVSCTGDGAQQFVVRRAMETDIDRLMEVQFSAFRNDPYHEALFPGPHDSPLVRKLAGQRTLEDHGLCPSTNRRDSGLRFLEFLPARTAKGRMGEAAFDHVGGRQGKEAG